MKKALHSIFLLVNLGAIATIFYLPDFGNTYAPVFLLIGLSQAIYHIKVPWTRTHDLSTLAFSFLMTMTIVMALRLELTLYRVLFLALALIVAGIGTFRYYRQANLIGNSERK